MGTVFHMEAIDGLCKKQLQFSQIIAIWRLYNNCDGHIIGTIHVQNEYAMIIYLHEWRIQVKRPLNQGWATLKIGRATIHTHPEGHIAYYCSSIK